jgi:hypothetical protein
VNVFQNSSLIAVQNCYFTNESCSLSSYRDKLRNFESFVAKRGPKAYCPLGDTIHDSAARERTLEFVQFAQHHLRVWQLAFRCPFHGSKSDLTQLLEVDGHITYPIWRMQRVFPSYSSPLSHINLRQSRPHFMGCRLPKSTPANELSEPIFSPH